MASNLSLDPDLIERAMQVSGESTKKAAVTRAGGVHCAAQAKTATRFDG